MQTQREHTAHSRLSALLQALQGSFAEADLALWAAKTPGPIPAIVLATARREGRER